MKYEIELSPEEEQFLDLYLSLYPLREGHMRKDYPGLIAHNFIGSMMQRVNEMKGIYRDRTGKEWGK